MNNSLYTYEIKNYVKTRAWPKGLVFDVIEYPQYLGFRFYVDNFSKFDGEDRLQIAGQVKEVMEKIRGLGIPCYLEKAATVHER